MKFADLVAKLRGAQNSERAKIENAVVAEIIDQTLRKSEMDAIDYQYLRGILLGMTASITINFRENEELKKERNIFHLARRYEQKYSQKW